VRVSSLVTSTPGATNRMPPAGPSWRPSATPISESTSTAFSALRAAATTVRPDASSWRRRGWAGGWRRGVRGGAQGRGGRVGMRQAARGARSHGGALGVRRSVPTHPDPARRSPVHTCFTIWRPERPVAPSTSTAFSRGSGAAPAPAPAAEPAASRGAAPPWLLCCAPIAAPIAPRRPSSAAPPAASASRGTSARLWMEGPSSGAARGARGRGARARGAGGARGAAAGQAVRPSEALTRMGAAERWRARGCAGPGGDMCGAGSFAKTRRAEGA
jgi:hypothetical protein